MKENHSTVHHHVIDRVIVISSFVSGLSLFPEVYRVFSTHTTNTMSQTSLFIILLNSLVWVMYGLHCKMGTLLISSTLTILASGSLIIVNLL
ncbi:MAG: hypothetical protein JWN37_77 [Candidatus Nomurabacteria bacterium]|nr:hypothetical protein [Candidatus Nomurabacteria bacterium]